MLGCSKFQSRVGTLNFSERLVPTVKMPGPVFKVLQVVVVVVEEDAVVSLLLLPLRHLRQLVKDELRRVIVGGERIFLRSVDQREGGRPLVLPVDELLLVALERQS